MNEWMKKAPIYFDNHHVGDLTSTVTSRPAKWIGVKYGLVEDQISAMSKKPHPPFGTRFGLDAWKEYPEKWARKGYG